MAHAQSQERNGQGGAVESDSNHSLHAGSEFFPGLWLTERVQLLSTSWCQGEAREGSPDLGYFKRGTWDEVEGDERFPGGGSILVDLEVPELSNIYLIASCLPLKQEGRVCFVHRCLESPLSYVWDTVRAENMLVDFLLQMFPVDLCVPEDPEVSSLADS